MSHDLAGLTAADAAAAEGPQPWRLEYEKVEKKGTKVVADLKPPPARFADFLRVAVAKWCEGESEGADYAAAYGTSTAVDGKGNTKPTAFHFTAANQQFLGAVEAIRVIVTADWARTSLFVGRQAVPGSNLRWDPASDRSYALMAENPNSEGTSVDAPIEWLAFRGLPVWVCGPRGSRVWTTGVKGRGDDMIFSWPLWSEPAGLNAVRSLVSLQWPQDLAENRGRGVFAACSSAIRRTPQGFGNFGPASVEG